jgi:quercetin dioxygenase-like cupin family protein
MILQGTLTVVHDDGSEITVSAGDAYSFAPGHDAWVVGNEEVIGYEFNIAGKDYAVWKSSE